MREEKKSVFCILPVLHKQPERSQGQNDKANSQDNSSLW